MLSESIFLARRGKRVLVVVRDEAARVLLDGIASKFPGHVTPMIQDLDAITTAIPEHDVVLIDHAVDANLAQSVIAAAGEKYRA